LASIRRSSCHMLIVDLVPDTKRTSQKVTSFEGPGSPGNTAPAKSSTRPLHAISVHSTPNEQVQADHSVPKEAMVDLRQFRLDLVGFVKATVLFLCTAHGGLGPCVGGCSERPKPAETRPPSMRGTSRIVDVMFLETLTGCATLSQASGICRGNWPT
jgi:hypothetical protein